MQFSWLIFGFGTHQLEKVFLALVKIQRQFSWQ